MCLCRCTNCLWIAPPRTTQCRCWEFLNLQSTLPFLPQTFNAMAQSDETTRMRTCNKVEFHKGTGVGRDAEVEASEIEEGTVAFMQDGEFDLRGLQLGGDGPRTWAAPSSGPGGRS